MQQQTSEALLSDSEHSATNKGSASACAPRGAVAKLGDKDGISTCPTASGFIPKCKMN